MSKIEFYLLVPIEVLIFIGKRFLAVKIILLQITLINSFYLVPVLK